MQKEETAPTLPPRIEVKKVKHHFSPEERNELGSSLARAIGEARGITAEFDQIKASYKSKTAEAEARIESLSTSLVVGFELRDKSCVVVLEPKTRKKWFFLEDADEDDDPVLIEDMTADDFQEDLIRAEAKFSHREEITLFPPTGQDSGVIVVGKFQGKWFAALRVKIGQRKLEERLDSEQPCSIDRFDSIQRTSARFIEWVMNALGKEAAKGFAGPLAEIVAAHKERVE